MPEEHDRLATEQVRAAPVDRHRDRLRQQVDREQPRERREPAEAVHHRRHRGGDDRRVQRHQRRAEHQRDQDGPALGAESDGPDRRASDGVALLVMRLLAGSCRCSSARATEPTDAHDRRIGAAAFPLSDVHAGRRSCVIPCRVRFRRRHSSLTAFGPSRHGGGMSRIRRSPPPCRSARRRLAGSGAACASEAASPASTPAGSTLGSTAAPSGPTTTATLTPEATSAAPPPTGSPATGSATGSTSAPTAVLGGAQQPAGDPTDVVTGLSAPWSVVLRRRHRADQ